MVAATKSRVCEAFGVPSPRKIAAAGRRGFRESDLSRNIEVTRNLFNEFNSIHDDNRKSRAHDGQLQPVSETCNTDAEYPVAGGESSGTCLKCRRCQPGIAKRNSGFKHSHKDPFQLKDVMIGPVTPGNGVDNYQLLEQTGRGDAGELEIPSRSRELPATPLSKPSSESIIPPMLKFGMYAGRVKANPLKYLATVLRAKLQLLYEPCSLLEIATQIHDEAKNKHNTTLRRIYDVVNVLEAAGLLERSNGSSTPSNRLRGSPPACQCTDAGSPSTSAAQSKTADIASDDDFFEYPDEYFQGEEYFRHQTIRENNSNPVLKGNVRGSRIRWLGSESESEEMCKKQTLGRLDKERSTVSERISAKQREFVILQEELRLTTELIKHNQNRNNDRHTACYPSHVKPCTPPREEDRTPYSYLNFEQTECSQTSDFADTGSTQEWIELEALPRIAPAAKEPSEFSDLVDIGGVFDHESISDIEFSSMISKEHPNFWYDQPAREFEMTLLEAAEHYKRNGFPLAITGIAEKGLYVPFVILQTTTATNVDIELDGDQTSDSEVYIALDNEYHLFDYREILSSMFPKHVI